MDKDNVFDNEKTVSESTGKYYLFQDETYAILGAAIEVHKQLGPGFLEGVYQEALEIELNLRMIPYVAKPPVEIHYKNVRLRKTYEPDFICYDKILLEIKALDRLSSIEDAQIINYLKATGLRIGLLVNFGSEKTVEKRRFAN